MSKFSMLSKFVINFIALLIIGFLFFTCLDHLILVAVAAMFVLYFAEYASKKIKIAFE